MLDRVDIRDGGLAAAYWLLVLAVAVAMAVDSAMLASRWRREGSVGRMQAVMAPLMWFVGASMCPFVAVPIYVLQRGRVVAAEVQAGRRAPLRGPALQRSIAVVILVAVAIGAATSIALQLTSG